MPLVTNSAVEQTASFSLKVSDVVVTLTKVAMATHQHTAAQLFGYAPRHRTYDFKIEATCKLSSLGLEKVLKPLIYEMSIHPDTIQRMLPGAISGSNSLLLLSIIQ